VRIAINTLAMRSELYGVGNYIKNLVAALSRIDSENEYLLFVSRENAHHLAGLPANFRLELAPGGRGLRLPWEQTVLPFLLQRKRIDVYHGPMFVAPFVKTCRQVVSILDMTFHLTPSRHSLHKQIYFRSIIPRMVRRSDYVITISESTKRDVLALLKTDDEKVFVTHLGVDPRFKPVADSRKLAEIRGKYNLPREFVLFVGLIEPRKNLDTLLDAYLADSVSAHFDLVLAGSLGWGFSDLMRKINSNGARGSVRMLGYVDDADLPGLYTASAAFVYPSFYEGFGLPVLEAMACGAPVITSNVSSLPEVTGDAAILINPHSVQDLAGALQRVLRDGDLRAALSERAIERAGKFTWEQTARKTLEVYKRAGESN
jgi:glycosyltransferase involved in cell wall biosynthesis